MKICTSWLVAFFLTAPLLLGQTNGASAHGGPNAPFPSIRAHKTGAELVLDGKLDEPFWAECETGSDFIDTRTHRPADQQTLVRVAHTNRYLYIGVECLDDRMDELRASERREDREFVGDDWVEVHLDPTHSHRAKYAFFTNPLGTPADANEGPSGQFNRGWTAEWDLAAWIGEDRWTFEMRLPFSILNYFRGNDQTWGINFTRYLVRTDTTSFWSFNDTDYYKPRYFGHLTGLDLAETEFGRNWEITPYVSTRTDFNGGTSSMFQTGVDASFRLTPSIVSAWTLNPDFGQVEADDDTIELRDTERFLTEKRRFFREGNELLNMKRRLYYSRRFTDIQAGAKISGEWENTKFAFLDILGDTSHGGTRSGNSAVFRGLRSVGEQSTLGFYLNDSEFDDGHSRVGSVDGELFFNDDWRYLFQGSASDDRKRGVTGIEKDSLDFLSHQSLVFRKYPWMIDVGYDTVTEEFNPELGYIPRRDIFGPSFEIMYNHDSDNRFYKDLNVFFQTELYENGDGETTLRDFELYTKMVFPNDFGLTAEQSFDYHAPFDNTRSVAGFVLFDSDFWRETEFEYATGEFEEVPYDEFAIGKNWKPIDRWPIRYELVIRLEDDPLGGNGTVWLNRIVFDYYFTDEMWLKTSLQHRNAGGENISVIYGWEFVRDAHWYLVFNRVGERDEPSSNSVFTKITYTF